MFSHPNKPHASLRTSAPKNRQTATFKVNLNPLFTWTPHSELQPPRVFTHKRTSPVVTRLGYETRGASDISARAAVMCAGEMTSERQKGSDPWRGDGSAPPLHQQQLVRGRATANSQVPIIGNGSWRWWTPEGDDFGSTKLSTNLTFIAVFSKIWIFIIYMSNLIL